MSLIFLEMASDHHQLAVISLFLQGALVHIGGRLGHRTVIEVTCRLEHVTHLKSSNFKDSFSALTLSENSRSNPPRKNMCSHCSKSSFDKTLINCGGNGPTDTR